jgi:Tfp pilus assembly protein PilE
MNKQKGFTAVEIIIVVVAVLVLGFIGWRVWDAQQQANREADQALQQANQQTQQNTTKTSGQFIEFKELGLKVPAKDDFKDLEYKYNNSNADYPSVVISTKSLTEKSSECGVNGSAPALGSLTKTTKSTNEQGVALVADGEHVFKVGNAFVIYQHAQATCTADSAVQAMVTAQANAFMEAVKQVQLAQ